jgi:hypothetical protein
MMVPLPVAPRPYPDELISSWVDRVSCRYGLSRTAWLAALPPSLPSGSASRRLDWQADPADLAVLGEACRIDPGLLRRLDLAEMHPAWPRHWFSWAGYEPGHWGDIAPAFCRRCFRDDMAAERDAYLRQAWARALGMCQAHHEPLTRSCAWCGAACGPRRSWRLGLSQNVARYVCRRCGHFVDQQPSPGRVDDPSDPLWRYAREPISPEIAKLIVVAWRAVTQFEALIIAALADPPSPAVFAERAAAAGFIRAVEDLAVLCCRRIAADGDSTLLDGRGTEAFPLPAGRFRGVAHVATPLAFMALSERQAAMAAIAELLQPPPAAPGSAPFTCRTVIEATWRLDFERLARLLDAENRLWLRTRAGAWSAALRERVNPALYQEKSAAGGLSPRALGAEAGCGGCGRRIRLATGRLPRPCCGARRGARAAVGRRSADAFSAAWCGSGGEIPADPAPNSAEPGQKFYRTRTIPGAKRHPRGHILLNSEK